MKSTMNYAILLHNELINILSVPRIQRSYSSAFKKNTIGSKKQNTYSNESYCIILSSFNSKTNLNFYHLVLDWAEMYFDIKSTFGKRLRMKDSSQKIMLEHASVDGLAIVAVHNSISSLEMHISHETQNWSRKTHYITNIWTVLTNCLPIQSYS